MKIEDDVEVGTGKTVVHGRLQCMKVGKAIGNEIVVMIGDDDILKVAMPCPIYVIYQRNIQQLLSSFCLLNKFVTSIGMLSILQYCLVGL